MLHNRNRLSLLAVVVMSLTSLTSAAFLPLDSSIRRYRNSSARAPLATFPRGGSSNPTSLSAVIFDNAPFWQAQSVIAGANALGLVISLATGSHLHLDLLGTGAFGLMAAVPFMNSVSLLPRVQWSSLAVIAWATKLAGFLFFRALKVKQDARLTDILSTSGGTTMFWVLSSLWGAVCSLPHTLGTTSSDPGNPTAFKVGVAMYVVGLITETLADYQKWVFKVSNPGQFCDVGLWSISQHPNFFGNLLVWSGIFVMNAPALVDPMAKTMVGKYSRVGLALLSPLILYPYFYGQASGAISNTVELFEKKYGDNPGYRDYVDTVPLIIPNPLNMFQ